MRRGGIASLLVIGCTPGATLVGAWTGSDASTGDITTGTTSIAGSSDGASSSTGVADASSGESGVGTSSSGGTTAHRWVLTLDAELRIQLVDLDTGELAAGCALAIERPDALSLVPDGRLVGAAFAGSTMWSADPCDCTVTPIAAIDPPLVIRGLADLAAEPAAVVVADLGRTALTRVAMDDASVIGTAEFAAVAELGALASRSGDGSVHALLGAAPVRLVALDLATGNVQSDVTTTIPDDARALVEIPGEAAFVACDPWGAFWRVEIDDGTTTAMAASSPAPCHVLARPHAPIACLDALFGS